MSNKILILGSAPETKDFIDTNPDLSTYDKIFAINNSGRLIPSPFIHCISTDFYNTNEKVKNKNIIKVITAFKFNSFGKQKKYEYGYSTDISHNMFLNVLYHVLNEHKYDEIHVCGCDYDYSREKTHFYNGGKSDPINHKNGVQRLILELQTIKSLPDFEKIKVINKSKNSLLPFYQI